MLSTRNPIYRRIPPNSSMRHQSTLQFSPFALGALAALLLPVLPSPSLAAPVSVREERIVLPTYVAGDPEPNPMFYFGRASQGAEGRVYPYPLYDTLTSRREDRAYAIVWLENKYLRLGILPDIGGRLFEGVDKSNGYHFIYRQHVIKPALIGLIGAWISGGIEWNIPHHHRASTFIPVQHRIEEFPDGSKTVWVGELEIRHRTRWAVGYTLHPERSYLEAKLRLVNRTPAVETMLCFANVAVHVNEAYQVIFPPLTQFVTHHHKREFTTWPVATTRYGGYDFTSGIDVSWYSNHVAANSMFAWNDQGDFMAGYDHAQQAGLMSVANRHIVPGKKLWTWGTGPRGRMWDNILTDNDGPYIELMVGAYSDNQPDYSWLQPFETKSFSIFWYPFQHIGGVKQANIDAALNLEITHNVAHVGFCVTAPHRKAIARLTAHNQILLDEIVSIDPAHPILRHVTLPPQTDPHQLRASLSLPDRELVAYSPAHPADSPMPDPVTPPPAPSDTATIEELYLAGVRVEQFHNPSMDPEPYWEEALRRDPGDARVNTVLGIRLFKHARFNEAESHFRKALQRLTANYTTPRDAEPLYYLALALKAQDRPDEAYQAFYQVSWNNTWRAAAYYGLAEIDTARRHWTTASEHLDRSLQANALNLRALNLKAAVLRHLQNPKQALAILDAAASTVDPLDTRLLTERWLASRRSRDARAMIDVMTQHPDNALETAAEFLNAGLWTDGESFLTELVRQSPEPSAVSPLIHYYLATFASNQGRAAAASSFCRIAADASPDYVFPFQHEAITVLNHAIHLNPSDPRAPYYLGNLLFDWQPARAIELWQRSAELDPSWPIVHRNLAIAYSHQKTGNALNRAIASLEQAVSLPNPYPLHFYELDELYEAAGIDPARRLATLERHASIVARRDDAQARFIALKLLFGQYDDAISMMTGRHFNVWEGASLSVADYWTDAHLLRGHQHRTAGRPQQALADYTAALDIPDNLPSERRGAAGRTTEILYWSGVAHADANHLEQARQLWSQSATITGASDEQRFYQALALSRLGRTDEAIPIFNALIDTGLTRLEKIQPIDFFASFGDQQSQRARLAQGHYLAGLGHQGLDQRDRARDAFSKTLEIRPDHLHARAALQSLQP
jgi:tetratricopeptide (TPR) repeat protein